MIHRLNEDRCERAAQKRVCSDCTSTIGLESVDEVVESTLEDGEKPVSNERDANERGNPNLLFGRPPKDEQPCRKEERAEHHRQQPCFW